MYAHFHHRHAKIDETALRRRWPRDSCAPACSEGSAVSEPPQLLPSQLFNASKSRRSAAACGTFAANAVSPADRALLLRMQRSWIERARYQDWLDGLPPNPPERANALAVPQRS